MTKIKADKLVAKTKMPKKPVAIAERIVRDWGFNVSSCKKLSSGSIVVSVKRPTTSSIVESLIADGYLKIHPTEYLHPNHEGVVRIYISALRSTEIEFRVRHTVQFEHATDEQLMITAKHCGLDEVHGFADMWDRELTKADRKKLIMQFRSYVYQLIDVTNELCIFPVAI